MRQRKIGFRLGIVRKSFYSAAMETDVDTVWEFSGELWYWRGPAPFYFITVPEDVCVDLRAIANQVSYGWGMIPVHAEIGDREWPTSLFPKGGRYVLPVRGNVRTPADLDDGDVATVRLAIRTGLR
jgi:hypothetical protein